MKETIRLVDDTNSNDFLSIIGEFVSEVMPEKNRDDVISWYRGYFNHNGYDSLMSFMLYLDERPIACIQLFKKTHPPMLDRKEYKDAELMNFYVIKEYRNKGLGQKLLDRINKEVVKQDIDCVRLNSSPDAESIYERNGYKQPPFKVYQKWFNH